MEQYGEHIQHDFDFIPEFLARGYCMSNLLGVNLNHERRPHVGENVAGEEVSDFLTHIAITCVTEEPFRDIWVAMCQNRLHQVQPLSFRRLNIRGDLMDVLQRSRVSYVRSMLHEVFDQAAKVLDALFMVGRKRVEQLATDG